MRWMIAAAAVLLAMLACGAGTEAARQPPLTGWLNFGNGPSRTGATAAGVDPAALRPLWFRDTPGVQTVQPLAVNGVPGRGQTTVYVATSAGRLVAYAPNGYVRWQRSLGVAPNPCPQLDGYRMTGTPVVDAATRAIYVADAFGLLHALDLVTGAERAGWPVQLYDDPSDELVWGALTAVRGSIYVGTASYCDQPMVGKLIRVEIASRRRTAFELVTKAQGGGGGIWGWGGVAYSATRDSLFAVTANAFEGGSNTGASFDEAAGYGEHLVEFSRDLHVRAADHPATVESPGDFDFSGSPVVFTPPGCAETVAATNKNGRLFLWRSAAIAQGSFVDLQVQPKSQAQPLLTQLAYDPRTRSLFVLTAYALVRVSVGSCDSAHVVWQARMPFATLHGSPTVAGKTVWITAAGSPASFRGYDTVTGRLRFKAAAGVLAFVPPAIVGGRVFQGAEHAFAVPRPRPSTTQAVVGRPQAYTSWIDPRHGWQSREQAVYATSDAGKTWRLIRRGPAQRVLALTATRGVISVGTPNGCNCAQQQLWTGDGGRSWHPTHVLTKDFSGAGNRIFTWTGNVVRTVAWPPRSPGRTTPLGAAVAGVEPAADGFVALLTSAGRGFDDAPRLALARRGAVSSIELPSISGRVLVRSLTVQWPQLAVRSFLYTDEGRQTVGWQSADGGESWAKAANDVVLRRAPALSWAGTAP
jgi:hypothetical protein